MPIPRGRTHDGSRDPIHQMEELLENYMESFVNQKLDNWGHLFAIRRLRSAESKEGYAYDNDWDNYAECDGPFRERMALELQNRKTANTMPNPELRRR
jgi:hypothetical protein